MNRVRLVVRVVGFTLLLLAVGMALRPHARTQTAYQKAVDNLAVPAARADDCPNLGFRCTAQGVCVFGTEDPTEGCIITMQGCDGCIH